MKKMFLIIALLWAFGLSIAQPTQHTDFPDMPIDENTKLVSYQEVVKQQGSADVLYERAVKWANKYYSNPTAVITKADKVNNTLVCVSNIKLTTLSKDGKSFTGAGFVYYTLTIEAKENRYRYTITDIYKKESARFPIEKWLDKSRPEWTPVRYDHLHQIEEAVRKLMEAIEEGMQPEKVIVDEW